MAGENLLDMTNKNFGMGTPNSATPLMPKPMTPAANGPDVTGAIDRVNRMLSQAGSGTVTRAALGGAVDMLGKVGGIQHQNMTQPVEELKAQTLAAGTESDIFNKTRAQDFAQRTIAKIGGMSGTTEEDKQSRTDQMGLLGKFMSRF